MDFRSYLAILRRRWLILVGSILLGAAAAVGVSALTQPQYEASAQLFVTATGGSSVVEAYQGNLFGEQRVVAYAKLAAGRQVAQRTIDALHLDMQPDELMSMVRAERVPADTVLLGIKVRNPNPDMARDIANAVAQQTTQLVEELETSPRGGLPAATTVLVDQAVAPTAPVVPNWYRNLAVGLVAGVLVGLVAAIARDRLDRSVSSVESAAKTLDVRAIGSVPPRPRRASAFPSAAKESAVVEAFRSIRTGVLAAANGNGPSSSHAIVIAEPYGGRASTTVTLGLASALAESGRSVCLVDCGLRQRMASRAVGLADAPGVFELLNGSRAVDKMLTKVGVHHLTVLPAGQPQDAEPGELLSREVLTQLIKHLNSTFNFVLIDGAPVLPYSDSGTIATSARGVLLVARAHSTDMVDLEAAATKLRMAGVEPMGIVLTDQKRPSHAFD
jgi:receptor protein-tyrosine kinase